MLKSLIFMQLPEVPMENLLRIFNHFPTLSPSTSLSQTLGKEEREEKRIIMLNVWKGGPKDTMYL